MGIMLLAVPALVMTPLKAQLMSPRDTRQRRWNLAVYGSAVAGLVLVHLFVGLAGWGADQTLRVLTESLALLLAGSLFAPTHDQENRGWLGWSLLALLYSTRVLRREPRPGSEFHLIDLYIWSSI